MSKHCIINGPNLNLLGSRETSVYGTFTLEQIQAYTESFLGPLNIEIDWFQSNIEGEIIDFIQKTLDEDYKSLIINPGGYSHTSVAILDALNMVKVPVVEVHLSNVHSREDFRQRMLTAKAANSIMGGLGKNAYLMAILSQELENFSVRKIEEYSCIKQLIFEKD
jgi:3-dehydroquinate dehydratase-2